MSTASIPHPAVVAMVELMTASVPPTRKLDQDKMQTFVTESFKLMDAARMIDGSTQGKEGILFRSVSLIRSLEFFEHLEEGYFDAPVVN